MIHRPHGLGALEFAVVSALRAAQLMRGCTPRLSGDDKPVTMAQREVAEGRVAREPDVPPVIAPIVT
jgi:DNA-directed RNA polymerase subunit K/omega